MSDVRWEYLVSDVHDADDEQSVLDSRGLEQWELTGVRLVTVSTCRYARFYFKRPEARVDK